MTTEIQTVAEIFTDARFMHSEALARLGAGDIRDAAEKAWCATRRATEALVLAQTNQHHTNTSLITRELRVLGLNSAAVRSLQDRYAATARFLHGDCFYVGLCGPIDDTERRIRETAGYIAEAEGLAGA